MVKNPKEASQQLLSNIVERVFVYGGNVLAVSLSGDFAVILDENKTAPGAITEAVRTKLENVGVMPLDINSQSGSDGSWGHKCILLIPPYSTPNHITVLTFPRWYPYVME